MRGTRRIMYLENNNWELTIDHSFRRSSMGLGRWADGAASRAIENQAVRAKRVTWFSDLQASRRRVKSTKPWPFGYFWVKPKVTEKRFFASLWMTKDRTQMTQMLFRRANTRFAPTFINNSTNQHPKDWPPNNHWQLNYADRWNVCIFGRKSVFLQPVYSERFILTKKHKDD